MPKFSKDHISTWIWIVCGLAISAASVKYGIGMLDSPGAGFMPFLAGATITILSLIGIGHATLNRKNQRGQPGANKFVWKKSLLVLLSLFIMLEAALRRSLLFSAGDPSIFFTRPISAVLMILSFFLFGLSPYTRVEEKERYLIWGKSGKGLTAV